MDNFEKKYGIKENGNLKAFHKSRRMFYIYQNKLVIAGPNLPYSHAVWFEKEGWISRKNDGLMDSIVRGFVDSKGNVYFYRGYNFEINKKVESIFFSHLKELIKKLDLDPDAKIFGGLTKQKPGEIWSPKKEYGKIKDNV